MGDNLGSRSRRVKWEVASNTCAYISSLAATPRYQSKIPTSTDARYSQPTRDIRVRPFNCCVFFCCSRECTDFGCSGGREIDDNVFRLLNPTSVGFVVGWDYYYISWSSVDPNHEISGVPFFFDFRTSDGFGIVDETSQITKLIRPAMLINTVAFRQDFRGVRRENHGQVNGVLKFHKGTERRLDKDGN